MKTLQRTLTIVKPDAVRRHAIGDIIEQFEKNGFSILCMKMLEISQASGGAVLCCARQQAVLQFAD